MVVFKIKYWFYIIDKGDRLVVKIWNCFFGSDKYFMSYGLDLKLNLIVMYNNFCFKFCFW